MHAAADMALRRSSSGFMLVEALITLNAFVFLLVIWMQILFFMTHFNIQPLVSQTDLAFVQLTSRLRLSSVVEVVDHKACFHRFETSFCLEFIHQKLIKTPGTEIFIRDIDLMTFYIFEDCLMLKVVTNESIWDQCIYSFN